MIEHITRKKLLNIIKDGIALAYLLPPRTYEMYNILIGYVYVF